MIEENVNLAPYTYYKIGGPARYFVKPKNLEELKQACEFKEKNKLPFFILGAGSNILFNDNGFDGLVINTSLLNKTLSVDDLTIICGCSVLAIHVLRLCMKEGYSGLEFLVGIPGSMGGVFYMNAGTKIGEIKDVLKSVTIFNLKTLQTRHETNLKYSYRKQHFLESSDLILSGQFVVEKSEPNTVQKNIQSLLDLRKKAQPIDKPSCGSVFKNPQNNSAWKLIDQVGLRGKQIGMAQISPMHSNFIVNLGGARASDVRQLIELAKKLVLEKTGIELEEEVKIL
ncbi:MAG: UDP-N-acetylmuramate dehydrogenase [Bacteriovoracia bacterium]